MTDAEAKRCLERIVSLQKEGEKYSTSTIFLEGEHSDCSLYTILSAIAAGICLVIYLIGLWMNSGILAIIGVMIMFFARIGLILSLIFVVVFGLLTVRYKSKMNKINNQKEEREAKRAALDRERSEIGRKLDSAFPQAVAWGIKAASHYGEILKKMNWGKTYIEACWSVKCDRDYEREFGALDRARAAEKAYRQAVLNEQRRTNEALENLQRQQEYENWQREQEYSRRRYEDLKREVNKK